MVKNILLSFVFAIVLPTIMNIIFTKSSNEKITSFVFNKTYIIKLVIVFLTLIIVFTLWDLLW